MQENRLDSLTLEQVVLFRRRLPKILKYIPGKAQDLRAWFLCMQYWLGGSDDNVEAMIRFLISRYASRDFGAVRVPESATEAPAP